MRAKDEGEERDAGLGVVDPQPSFSYERRSTLALNLEQKKSVVAEISAEVKGAQAIIVAEYRHLQVGEITKLRAKARGSGVYFRVLKNTLARRAVADTPFAGLADHMVGPLAYGMSSDPVAVARVLHDFAKGSNEKFVIKAGAMAGSVMNAKDVANLATLPGRDQLLAMLMGTMKAPIGKFVRTLNEVPGKFVRTMAALRDSKQTAEQATEQAAA